MKENVKKNHKKCQRYKSGNGFRFQEDCAYNHTDEKEEQHNQLKVKMDILEKIILESTKKVEGEKVEQLNFFLESSLL